VEAATTAAAAAEAASRTNDSEHGWARRLERFAVFYGAQGREDSRSGHVQLEGLTVLPNEDGSNAVPLLMLLAFVHPQVCGGAAPSGCSVLCDLDAQRVRAVSLFGHSEDTRWVVRLHGKKRLGLRDLQRVNELRNAVSAAFEVVDEESENANAPGGERQVDDAVGPVIREDPEIVRALGALFADAGQGLSPFEDELDPDESGQAPPSEVGPSLPVEEVMPSAPLVATAVPPGTVAVAAPPPAGEASSVADAGGPPKREFGDVWIDLAEEGWNRPTGGFFSFEDVPILPREEPPPEDTMPETDDSGGFFSFDTPVEKIQERAVEPKLAAEDAERQAAALAVGSQVTSSSAAGSGPGDSAAAQAPPVMEPAKFAFLPALTLPAAFAERVQSFREMQAEAGEVAARGRGDVKAAEQNVRAIRDTSRQVDSAMEAARHAWNLGRSANNVAEANRAMERAVNIMREVNTTMTILNDLAGLVEESHRSACERETRAVACNETAPHLYMAAAKAAKVARGKLNFQWNLTTTTVQRAQVSQRTALAQADRTVRLVNEKMQRWADEDQIRAEEAQKIEEERQTALRQQKEAVLMAQQQAQQQLQRQQQEATRQQMELERQRVQAIQWGRHLVQPIPNLQFIPDPPAPVNLTVPPLVRYDLSASVAPPPPPPQGEAPPPPSYESPPPPPPPDMVEMPPPPGPPPGAPPLGAPLPPGPPAAQQQQHVRGGRY